MVKADWYLAYVEVEAVQQQTPFISSIIRWSLFIKIEPLPGKCPLAQQDTCVTVFRRHWNT